MTEINSDFVAPCGLYCGVCARRIAHQDGKQRLKEKLVSLYRGKTPGKGKLPKSEGLTVEDIRCRGCLSGDLFVHCR